MSRSVYPAYAARTARCLTGRCLALLCALALLPALAALPARAAEFATPPGINVEAQEQLLTERVRQLARDLVGDKLVDVQVHVGYLRTETGPGGRNRVKLPGFNNYITDETVQGEAELVPAFTRVRQIFVMVDDTFGADPAQIERQLRISGQFDPAAGDWVKVIPVPRPAEDGETMAGEGKPGQGRKPPREPRAREQRPEESDDPLAEAEASTFLVRARTAYFNGDYDRALDQILQSLYKKRDNPQAYAMLGSLYYTMNWSNLAVKYWERSLELDPDNQRLRELVQQVRQSTPTAGS